jgi:hypothetical protein
MNMHATLEMEQWEPMENLRTLLNELLSSDIKLVMSKMFVKVTKIS